MRHESQYQQWMTSLGTSCHLEGYPTIMTTQNLGQERDAFKLGIKYPGMMLNENSEDDESSPPPLKSEASAQDAERESGEDVAEWERKSKKK